MSQNKVEDVYMIESNNRIQTRRTSRSARSASPVMEEEVSSPVSSDELNQNIGNQATNNSLVSNGGRVTRSQSVESSGYETTDSRKRKRKAKNGNQSNKKRVGAGSDSYSKATPPPPPSSSSTAAAASASASTSAAVSSSSTPPMNSNVQNGSNLNGDGERETRNTAQRISKEAREAKKAQRDLIIKERQVENQLTELDKLEKAVKDGSHSEYHKLLSDIESKRTKMLSVAEMRRSLAEGNVNNFFNSQKYAAYSQYYWDKLALRRSMIQHVQHKINTLEQEYYSNHVQSLTEDDAENDIEWAKQDPTTDEPIYASYQQQQYPNKHQQSSPPPPSSNTYFRHDTPPAASTRDSPPLDMLASLADGQHQKDFKEEPTEKSFTLPPLNPWRHNQRPPLPI
ncbi:hypothetical protein HMPREF1544_05115 [Mucor circinelloides 1006PhL]|uniref:Uncharacterized protein n=1 Tax=Mucor circinelloides f. circinelloides (strain 1006PhL) TaxID=1220926 RepID=S2JZ13_MUCC1|nr:hypothetical protein HMPREF1544_05115 [Mucor circinelloides 1006PhL]